MEKHCLWAEFPTVAAGVAFVNSPNSFKCLRKNLCIEAVKITRKNAILYFKVF